MYWERGDRPGGGSLCLPMPLLSKPHTIPHPGLASFAPVGRGIPSNLDERRVGVTILQHASIHSGAIECFLEHHSKASWELPPWLVQDLCRVSHRDHAPQALPSLEVFHGLDEEERARRLPIEPLFVTTLFRAAHSPRVWADFAAISTVHLSN